MPRALGAKCSVTLAREGDTMGNPRFLFTRSPNGRGLAPIETFQHQICLVRPFLTRKAIFFWVLWAPYLSLKSLCGVWWRRVVLPSASLPLGVVCFLSFFCFPPLVWRSVLSIHLPSSAAIFFFSQARYAARCPRSPLRSKQVEHQSGGARRHRQPAANRLCPRRGEHRRQYTIRGRRGKGQSEGPGNAQ